MFIKLDGTKVILEHYALDQLTAKQIAEGHVVTAVKPEPQKANATLHYDVEKAEFYYTYANDSEIEELKAQADAFALAIAELDEQRELDKTEMFLALSEIAEMGGI